MTSYLRRLIATSPTLRDLKRLRGFLRRHARDIKDGVIHLWWVFVIVMPLCGFVLYLAIDYTNAKAARQQAHSNQQFRQSQILANQKFQQAIRIALAQSAYAQNKSVCGFRTLLAPTLDDKRVPPARREQISAFLETQVTVPSHFKCSTLPKNPPRP